MLATKFVGMFYGVL
jgi:hypothetical protein